MNVLPVIQRELRDQARHAFTYWLRVIGAGAVLAMVVFFAANVGLRPNSGGELFAYLHGILHGSIWLLVPLLTADCLSRERREGTLGLLFLTPLKARDIVVAKGIVHGLRAATLLLAVVPIAALPALIGGVGGRQAIASLALNSSAACLALAAGLLASAASRSWVRSLLAAYGWAALFAVIFCLGLTQFFTLALGRRAMMSLEHGFQLAVGINPEFFTASYYYRAGLPFTTAASSAQLFQAVVVAALMMWVCAVVVLLLAVLGAAAASAVNWKERPPRPAQVWLKQWLCTPVVMRDVLAGWMKRTIEHNPIGWLERRVWSGRLVIWGWFAVMVSLYSLLLTEPNFIYRSLDRIHLMMGYLLLGSMALNASGSFRRERETRVLELLLVSPLKEWQIIHGRLRGLWGQFLPSMVLLLCGWLYLAASVNQLDRSLMPMLGLGLSFLALPVIGLYFSLVCRNYLTALGSTLLVGVILPANALPIARLFVALLYWQRGFPRGSMGFLDLALNPALIQLFLAWQLIRRLQRRLVARRFVTEST